MRFLFLTIILCSFATTASAQVELKRVYASVELDQPVHMTQPARAPDGLANHWWVVEQKGRIIIFDGNAKTPKASVAMDIRSIVRSGGERGLLGLAFHTKFLENGHIFVNYTHDRTGGLKTRIARFTSKDSGRTFDPKSEVNVLEFDQPYGNHNGGSVEFGPDGRLYIAIGDGGAAGDPKDHGQNPKTLLGTIARINVDALPYTVPRDNPFVGKEGRSEIFAWGLRNPWKMSFDLKSGELWTADVGQNAWEEVNIVQLGKNYGWRILEGNHCYLPAKDCPRDGFEPPVTEYSHDEGKSVTGGYVYRGSKIKSLAGNYVFGDFVSGRIWAFNPQTKDRVLISDSGKSIASFVQARDGELGLLDYGTGRIFSLEPVRK